MKRKETSKQGKTSINWKDEHEKEIIKINKKIENEYETNKLNNKEIRKLVKERKK